MQIRPLLVAILATAMTATVVAQTQHATPAAKEKKGAKPEAVKPQPDKGAAKPLMKETPLGIIEIALYPKDAPKTVENFVKLAEKKYFNGILFHRVAKGFVIQGGDPTGKGSGGKSIWGGTFADELNPAAPSFQEGYKRGVVAMANRGPNTNTSQFFIMLTDNAMMPKLYSIFGKVASGMEVVDRIGSVELVPAGMVDGHPKVDIVMKTVSIVKMPDGTPHAKIEVVQREPLPATGK